MEVCTEDVVWVVGNGRDAGAEAGPGVFIVRGSRRAGSRKKRKWQFCDASLWLLRWLGSSLCLQDEMRPLVITAGSRVSRPPGLLSSEGSLGTVRLSAMQACEGKLGNLKIFLYARTRGPWPGPVGIGRSAHFCFHERGPFPGSRPGIARQAEAGDGANIEQ